MNQPLVSVVIPSLNQAASIANAVESVLSQSYASIELWVADGGSNDGTCEWLAAKQSADRRLRWFSQPDSGWADLLNKALHQVRGTVIGWLNPADCYAPGAIDRVVEAFLAKPDSLMVYGHGEHIDAIGNIVDRYPALSSSKAIAGSAICPTGIFFKRSLPVLLGPFDDACTADEYWLKAFTISASRIGFIDAVLTYSRQHDDGIGQDESLAIQASEPEPNSPLDALIKPEQLINRYTVAEHMQFADDYFKGRENHLYLYQKPFFHPRDCAPSVMNLGQLLAGASLDAGMRVMDFASGSCWLSRILVQLGCIVTSCDASAIALDIGKQLFEKYPPIADGFRMPEFYVFDGERLDFPDKSFDRILVNDAFHHVPNTAAVLAEFSRILKDDGLVGMSEPGRFHSRTEDSQFEMKEFNVIENDLVLETIWTEAEAAGFQAIQICPVLRQPYLDIDDYLNCIQGKVPLKVINSLIGDTVSHSIFFLHKSSSTDLHARLKISNREEFDEEWYLARNTDVSAGIAAGYFSSGWEHYERFGSSENRATRKLAVQ